MEGRRTEERSEQEGGSGKEVVQLHRALGLPHPEQACVVGSATVGPGHPLDGVTQTHLLTPGREPVSTLHSLS